MHALHEKKYLLYEIICALQEIKCKRDKMYKIMFVLYSTKSGLF